MTKEQDTAMYDQPDHEPGSWWEEVREVGRRHGLQFSTITLNEAAATLDIRSNQDKAKRAEPLEPPVSEFGSRVMSLLETAANTYAERNAVYQDNFRVVGKVMEALFPSGAPTLSDAADYNRWHIFELVIVKLTRYVANWSNPDSDSLVDMLPYLAILGAQDQEIRDLLTEQKVVEETYQRELKAKIARLRNQVREAGLYPQDVERDFDTQREEDNEAKMYAEDDAFDKVFSNMSKSLADPHVHNFKPVSSEGEGGKTVLECRCGASRILRAES